jgi:hypothetical protein
MNPNVAALTWTMLSWLLAMVLKEKTQKTENTG